MNFLSHYYLEQHHPSPYFRFASVFPDLLRQSHPRLKLHSMKPYETNTGKLLQEGIEKHFLADKAFHNSEFFKLHYGMIKDQFARSGFIHPERKSFFIAHILLEIILDRMIVLHENHVCRNFYNDLAEIDESHIENLLGGHPGYSHEKFSRHFMRFKTSRYLYSYSGTQHIVYALNKICMRTGIRELDPGNCSKIESCITEISGKMEKNYPGAFDEIKASEFAPGIS